MLTFSDLIAFCLLILGIVTLLLDKRDNGKK